MTDPKVLVIEYEEATDVLDRSEIGWGDHPTYLRFIARLQDAGWIARNQRQTVLVPCKMQRLFEPGVSIVWRAERVDA